MRRTYHSLWRWLIPDRIAPTPQEADLLRREAVINQCDYYEWVITTRLALINRHVAKAERAARLLGVSNVRPVYGVRVEITPGERWSEWLEEMKRGRPIVLQESKEVE